ncbi:phenazine-specific anthranilate synthase component I [Pseudonocardiaceae bacterium YIM PH 21723]|nr:phenazine-specific anthranilate synthase component I [Pseudonocardiaceae bacterium YIM PH 21723]
MDTDLLELILGDHPPAFALLHRPERTDGIEILIGDISEVDTVAEIPLREVTGHDVLVIVPYRQIRERGYESVDDGSPLLAMTVTRQEVRSVAEIAGRLPDLEITTSGGHFDVDDAGYADLVRRVINEVIGSGEGANFVIKRSYIADITDYTPLAALTLFSRLLRQESGAYWTFLVHTGERTFVGASPERHISVHDGTAVMNPISGTYRYPSTGPALSEVLAFLADPKETDELYMVLDEELKMMAKVCPDGGTVVGPYLREMAQLAHTEYFIEGQTTSDPRDILRATMFAPTVTGSPLESACRVIARFEPQGRGYYSGVIALIGKDQLGGRTLDSSILIRTADIDTSGKLRIGVGSTLVRHSSPESEVAETAAKARGLLAALNTPHRQRFGTHPEVQAALAQRNADVASFWFAQQESREEAEPTLAGGTVLIVEAEDTFTAMIELQLRSLGLNVTVKRYDEPYTFDGYDLIVMGPGPGDPSALQHPKIAHLDHAVDALLAERRPFLAVCLSHQVLSRRLGFQLTRRPVPNQGAQLEIDLFGRRELVGFYNAFAAISPADMVECGDAGPVQVCRDQRTGEVHALRGEHFASVQFHAESVLTRDGLRIIGTLLKEVAEHARHGRVVGSR